MNTYQSPEITVLLMACTLDISEEKKAGFIHFLGQNQIDWQLLYVLADRHRLKPFLYRALQKIANCPHEFLEKLQKDYQEDTTDNLLKLHHYHILSNLLIENGIDHIPLKGIYLAENAYPNPGLRPTGDLDILVSEGEVFKTIELLRTNGYELNKVHTIHWQKKKQALLTDLSEVSLFKPFSGKSEFDIDLHWQVLGFNKHYALFGLNYFRLNPELFIEQQIVLLAVHHGITNIWQRIYFINDLYFLLIKKEINWNWLLDELKQYGFEAIFLSGLYWCKKIWALSLPTFIESLVDTVEVEQLAKEYAANWARRESYELSDRIARQLKFMVKAQPGFRHQLKVYRTFFTSRIFQPSTFKFGKSYIYLPQEAGFITIFIRAMRSIWKFLPAKSVVVSVENKTGEDHDLARNESSQSAR
ncbi:nucleotidyltransferase domain-containing protein [Spirosoma gilvum]